MKLDSSYSEWETIRLSEHSHLKARIGWQALTTAEYLDMGEYYLVTGTDFVNGKVKWETCHFVDKTRYEQDRNIQLRIGDVLITKDGTIGKVAFVNFLPAEATLNSGVFVIRPKTGRYNARFLYYILSSKIFEDFLAQLQAGSTIIHLYQKDFVNFSFKVPQIAEQEAIVDVLTDIDAQITALDQLIAKKRDIKQGVMQELLTGKRRLPGFSGDWEKLNISEHSHLKARIGWQALTTAEYLKMGEYFLVTGTDFAYGKVEWETCHFVDKARYEQDRNIQLRVGDVLITKDGTIGKVAYIDRLPSAATLNSGVFVIRPKTDRYISRYLYYVLSSKIFEDFLAQLQAGSTIIHLYQKDFVKFLFSAPQVEEQKAIAAVISDIDMELDSLEGQRNKLFSLKQGVMNELLSGRTRLV